MVGGIPRGALPAHVKQAEVEATPHQIWPSIASRQEAWPKGQGPPKRFDSGTRRSRCSSSACAMGFQNHKTDQSEARRTLSVIAGHAPVQGLNHIRAHVFALRILSRIQTGIWQTRVALSLMPQDVQLLHLPSIQGAPTRVSKLFLALESVPQTAERITTLASVQEAPGTWQLAAPPGTVVHGVDQTFPAACHLPRPSL